MKTLDDAVIELNGKYPSPVPKNISNQHCRLYVNSIGTYIPADDVCAHDYVCTRDEFEQRAKELGFVNGYRCGVEYKADGKRPDLPDDVGVNAMGKTYYSFANNPVGGVFWDKVEKFIICDQRYKPADTSYLEKPALEPVPEEGCWYTYEMNVANQPAPVGTKVLVDCHHQGMKEGIVIGAFQRWNWIDVQGFAIETFDMILVKPLDHDRKAKAERKRVVDAAMKYADEFIEPRQMIEALYDKGSLKLPE